jgi:hypothetical protein
VSLGSCGIDWSVCRDVQHIFRDLLPVIVQRIDTSLKLQVVLKTRKQGTAAGFVGWTHDCAFRKLHEQGRHMVGQIKS